MAQRQGFPKRIRLCSRTEIQAVFQSGQYRRLGVLHVKYLPTARDEGRFLVSVKKKAGSAPGRNRIKRLVREAIRLNRDQLRSSYDVCLFLTRRPEVPCRLALFEEEILRLFGHLNRQAELRKEAS